MSKKEKKEYKYTKKKYAGYTLHGAFYQGQDLARELQEIYSLPGWIQDIKIEPEGKEKVFIYYKRRAGSPPPGLDLSGQEQKGLESKLPVVISIAVFVIALFFLSPNLTGNAILNMNKSGSNLIGAGLFVLGLVGLYFWKKK
jgi:hypothetical protein